jgi:hypothetical protein
MLRSFERSALLKAGGGAAFAPKDLDCSRAAAPPCSKCAPREEEEVEDRDEGVVEEGRRRPSYATDDARRAARGAITPAGQDDTASAPAPRTAAVEAARIVGERFLSNRPTSSRKKLMYLWTFRPTAARPSRRQLRV